MALAERLLYNICCEEKELWDTILQTVDKAPSCEGALSTVCLFIVIFTVIFFFPNHASYFL